MDYFHSLLFLYCHFIFKNNNLQMSFSSSVHRINMIYLEFQFACLTDILSL